MNKLASLSLAALFVAVVACPSEAQNLSAGVKGGIDFANLGADAEDLFETSLKSKFGYSGGAFFAIDVHEMFRLQFEGQYVRKGASAEEEGVDIDLKLDYIEFMVPATLLIPVENSPLAPRIYAGPALGIEASCKISGEEGGVSVDVDCEEFGAETKSIDFGVFAGAGLDIAVGTSGAITLDVLYNLGLTNINDTPEAEGFDVTNRNLQVLVGYRFMFGA